VALGGLAAVLARPSCAGCARALPASFTYVSVAAGRSPEEYVFALDRRRLLVILRVRLLAVILAVAVCGVSAPAAMAISPEKRIARLERKVERLERLARLQAEMNGILNARIDLLQNKQPRVSTYSSSTLIAPGASSETTASCLLGGVAVGGGFYVSNSWIGVGASQPGAYNSWRVWGVNSPFASTPQTLHARVVCLNW
jgi:hypothetical protein